MRGFRQPFRTPVIRTLVGVSFVALAILFPNLDEVMSVLGVVAGLLIAVILPIGFYLSILGDEVSSVEKCLCAFAIVVSSVLAVGSLSCTVVGFS
jgi:solute carrier family 32 (vesicular inhibitory amino acid transporter)